MAIRVLIVDDSPFMQRLLSTLIGGADDLKVVGVASDPIEARDLIKKLSPDVITLDVEMPRMDGITFLERLMRLRPMPVVMVSSFTEANAEVTLRALELGAVDFVTKPLAEEGSTEAFGAALVEKLRAAATAAINVEHPVARPASGPAQAFRSGTVIAIGASTGGTEVIREILGALPANAPPVLVVQHMPEMFTRLFARRLDELSALKVTEAEHGDLAQPGHAYIAPGDRHLTIAQGAKGYELRVDRSDPVNRHRPSVDVLFHSVAKVVGRRAAGVLLTGMGRDGAEGLGAMKRAGAPTFAQDQATCVVFGMPRAAIEAGHADHVGPVQELVPRIVESLGVERRGAAKDVVG